jgi:hypothetical protein
MFAVGPIEFAKGCALQSAPGVGPNYLFAEKPA